MTYKIPLLVYLLHVSKVQNQIFWIAHDHYNHPLPIHVTYWLNLYYCTRWGFSRGNHSHLQYHDLYPPKLTHLGNHIKQVLDLRIPSSDHNILRHLPLGSWSYMDQVAQLFAVHRRLCKENNQWLKFKCRKWKMNLL